MVGVNMMTDNSKTPEDNQPTDHLMTVAVGKGTGNSIKVEETTWPRIIKKLSIASVDDVGHAEYLELTKENRLIRKSALGYFILAAMHGDIRNNDAVLSRSGLQLDIEGSNVALATIQKALKDYEWHAHSTRSSTTGDKRYRVIIPYKSPVADNNQHKAIGDYFCNRLELFGISVDRNASTVLSQPAFFPTISNDQTFEHLFNKGDGLLDPEQLDISWTPDSGLKTVDLKPKVNINSQKIPELLSYLTKPEIVEDYWQWIKIGQALYHQFDGSQEGLELWDDWSARGSNYPSPEKVQEKWNTFSVANTNTVTLATVIHMAKDQGWHEDAPAKEEVDAISFGSYQVPCISTIPKREWVLGNRLMRGYISGVASPGGVGKSVLGLVTAVALASQNEITGENIHERTKVWYINYEDDQDELNRRLHGVVQKFGIDPTDFEGYLQLDSFYGKRGRKLIIDTENGLKPSKVAEQIAIQAKANNVGVIIFDPLVSTHDANENDNGAMNEVFSVLRQIASHTNAAIQVIAHTAKGSGLNNEAHAGSSDAGRGASSQRDALRFLHTFARMSADTAEKYGIPPEEYIRLVRFDNAKNNFALPDAEAQWFRLETIELANGDRVGVPEPFDMGEIIQQAQVQQEADRDEQQKEWRAQIAEVLTEDRMRLSAVRNSLIAVWQRQARAVEQRIKECVRMGAENALMVDIFNGKHLIWLEQGEGQTSPIFVCSAPWSETTQTTQN